MKTPNKSFSTAITSLWLTVAGLCVKLLSNCDAQSLITLPQVPWTCPTQALANRWCSGICEANDTITGFLYSVGDPSQIAECKYAIFVVPLRHEPDSLLVSLELVVKNHPDCATQFVVHRFLMQAFDEYGFPIGDWLPLPDEQAFRSKNYCIGPSQEFFFSGPSPFPIFQENRCGDTPALQAGSYHDIRPPGYIYFNQDHIPQAPVVEGFYALWKFNRATTSKPIPSTIAIMFVAEVFLDYKSAIYAVIKGSPYVFLARSAIYYYSPGFVQGGPVDLWNCTSVDLDLSSQFEVDGRSFTDPNWILLANFQYLNELNDPSYPPAPPPPPRETIPPRTTTSTTPGSITQTSVGTTPAIVTQTSVGTTPAIVTQAPVTTAAPEITIGTAAPPEPPPPEATPPSPEAVEEQRDIYERCELTKKCIASSEGAPNGVGERPSAGANQLDPCIKGKECAVMISYGDADIDFVTPDDSVYMEITGRSNFWVAMGLSLDQAMEEDFVIECVREEGGPNGVAIYTSWNEKRVLNQAQDNKRMNKSDPKYNFVILHKSGFVSGNLFCKFSIKKLLFYDDPNNNFTRHNFNLGRNLYFILMATGTSGSSADGTLISGESGNLNLHLQSQRFLTGYRVGLGSRFSPTPAELQLIHLHGQSMFVAFLFVFPTSTFIVRYYKETFVATTYFGLKQWSLYHLGLELLGLLLLILGHLCLTFANEDWSHPVNSDTTSYHFWASLTTATMYLFNALMGLLNRDRRVGATCDFCHWAHAMIGHFAYLIGIATLLRTEKVQYSYLPCAAPVVITFWIIVYFCFHVLMSYHYCWIDWVQGEVGRAYAIGPLQLLVQPQSSEVAPGKRVRLITLLVFVIVSGLITIALVVMAATNSPETACYQSEFFIDLS